MEFDIEGQHITSCNRAARKTRIVTYIEDCVVVCCHDLRCNRAARKTRIVTLTGCSVRSAGVCTELQ